MLELEPNQLSRRAFLTSAGAMVVALATPAEWADAAQFELGCCRRRQAGETVFLYLN